jgi:GT2 family glycosyltransferase
VIVVDDGSTDGTVDLLRSLAPPYTLRTVEQAHGGPAAARNRGVAAARGTLIVFLDDDVVPVPGLLAAHAAIHASAPDAVVIGPMSPPGNWSRPAWIRWEEEKLQAQYHAMLTGRYACTARQFYTGNASLARSQFVAAGGFDASFQRAEDVEFAYRLRDGGARFVFDPSAEVLHYPTRTFSAWCRTPYQYGRYDVIMHRDRGHEALPCALVEFRQRHALNRLLARACVGRRVLVDTAVLALRGVAQAADLLGAGRPAAFALSGIFNLLYWQGVSDELGGPQVVWRSMARSLPA